MRLKWFGPSLDGAKKCVPRTWQAWVATIVVVAMTLGGRSLLQPQMQGLPHWYLPAMEGFILAAYLLLIYWTYDPDL